MHDRPLTSTELAGRFGDFVIGTGGIGGIAATTGPGIGLSETAGSALLDRAMREGIRVVDTADVYTGGTSERVVGGWMSARRPDDVVVQTKTGMTPEGPDLSPARVRRQLTHSIDVLGRVDVFLAHRVDPATPWSEALPVFSSAVENRTIRAYGLSNVSAAALADALVTAERLSLVPPLVVQNSYSLVVRDDDADLLPIVEERDLLYTPYSPLATGLLAGRYSRGERPSFGSRASIASRVDEFLADAEVMDKVRRFDRVASERQVSPAGLALGWLVKHPIVTAPIISPTTDEQWAAVREARELQWSDELDTELRDIFG